ncbi:FadR family transcriptional regulator [Parasedimentitalea maritima]|uniref:FadR family transcriptional regulator n=1 Tax=Parasedimentitalea maritima TaxID=2578117 RepID=A0ABY2USV8_9RHOB|nr:FadR/GntR family transcriptional regulator [Zongyanglinia marina]TLP55958.1 FadR family transcriptional regulator [Zongyanglinia marina]
MIERTPVSQAIARQLQEMIQSGKLSSAERLPSQRVLSEQLGVSRPSLREALMTLETLGLIRTYPGRGTFVTDPQDMPAANSTQWRYTDDYGMADVFEVRLLLEGQLARHAAETSTLDDISLLTAATDKMEAAWAQGDLIANVDEDLEFHQLIAGKSRNSLLLQTYTSLSAMVMETQRQPIPFTALDRMASSIAEHRAIIAALNARDADAAQTAMVEHIRNTAACAGISI